MSSKQESGELKELTVLIVGASIAGLAAATALLHKQAKGELPVKLNVKLFERTERKDCVNPVRPRHGAGIVLEDDSIKILQRLGVPDKDLEELLTPMRVQEDRNRHGVPIRTGLVPYFGSLWFDTRKMLLNRLGLIDEEKTENILQGLDVHFEKEITGYKVDPETQKVTAQFADGSAEVGDVLVGADGATSFIREFGKFHGESGEDQMRYSGYTAWRGVATFQDLPIEVQALLATQFPKNHFYFEMSSKCHFVVYWLHNKVNWLLYECADDEATPVYKDRASLIGKITHAVQKEDFEVFCKMVEKKFQPAAAGLVKNTSYLFKNHIYDHDHLKTFNIGPVVLVGDSAHPTTPHHVRGSNMAIQDAWALAEALETSKNLSSVSDWLDSYTKKRHAHDTWVVETSRRLGRIKQGVFSEQQQDDWDLHITTDQFYEWAADEIHPILKYKS
jgi:2-polyprenyl-6-methoxyphenol hydroxylase-like FAD-dependent oxidoreductase